MMGAAKSFRKSGVCRADTSRRRGFKPFVDAPPMVHLLFLRAGFAAVGTF
jgi:hypothetical protein